jgi:hypothetical protein
MSSEVKPDFIADFTKENWWLNIEGKFNLIIDTISHMGTHIFINQILLKV